MTDSTNNNEPCETCRECEDDAYWDYVQWNGCFETTFAFDCKGGDDCGPPILVSTQPCGGYPGENPGCKCAKLYEEMDRRYEALRNRESETGGVSPTSVGTESGAQSAS